MMTFEEAQAAAAEMLAAGHEPVAVVLNPRDMRRLLSHPRATAWFGKQREPRLDSSGWNMNGIGPVFRWHLGGWAVLDRHTLDRLGGLLF
jgi:hypothetical protein